MTSSTMSKSPITCHGTSTLQLTYTSKPPLCSSRRFHWETCGECCDPSPAARGWHGGRCHGFCRYISTSRSRVKSFIIALLWFLILDRRTNADGRCLDLLPLRGSEEEKQAGTALVAGQTYKVVFRTKEYFDLTNRKSFYPWVEVCVNTLHV